VTIVDFIIRETVLKGRVDAANLVMPHHLFEEFLSQLLLPSLLHGGRHFDRMYEECGA
jgi:hypothetical protein